MGTNDSPPVEPPSQGSSPEELRFAREARRTGLSLPAPAPANVGLSLAVIVIVVLAAMGIGFLTGWTDLRGSAGSGLPLLYGPQNCGATPVQLYGSLDPSVSADFGAWLNSNDARILASIGGCVHLGLNTSADAGGASQLALHAVDFAAGPETPSSNATGTGAETQVFYPAAVGAVEVVYNLEGVSSGLVLNASVIAGLFDGTLTAWNSGPVQSLNPTLALGGQPPVAVVYPAGPSQATSVLSGFLAQGDPAWATTYGSGPSVAWPVGTAEPSSAAVAAHVAATPGSVGYLLLLNSSLPNLTSAAVVNPAGTAVNPTPANVTAAATAAGLEAAVGARDWPAVTTVNAAGADSYPLVAITYMGLYADLGRAYDGSLSLTNATWLMTVLWWVFESNAFVPLPATFTIPAQSVLTNVTYDGTVILQVQDSENGENGGETGEF